MLYKQHLCMIWVWVAMSRRSIRWSCVISRYSEQWIHDFIGLLVEDKITYSWFQQDMEATNSMKRLSNITEHSSSLHLWPNRSLKYSWNRLLRRATKFAVYSYRPTMLQRIKNCNKLLRSRTSENIAINKLNRFRTV